MSIITLCRTTLMLWSGLLLSCPAAGSSAVSREGVHASPTGQSAEVASHQAGEEGKPNRLVHEQSPYLLQHAYNPVNWYPWGKEAFEEARKEDKPIFLSIGYSTCHWCHVMEHESFTNPEIAALMNESFISVKVDREERPDLDSVYMAFVQATTGRGGWPMSVFLTPELKPFFGGTYFPPKPRPGMPGFPQVLTTVRRQWAESRDKILDSADRITAHLKGLQGLSSREEVSLPETLDKGYQWYLGNFDEKLGGFGSAPKFPRPVNLQFLLYYSQLKSQEKASEMVLQTLRSMARGGMNDHLGGGFHRYSTDERWFLPHFEKMLYDQAQLVVAYLEAFQISRDPFFAAVARRTLEYVLRDMTSPGGGFYSAEDADSPVAADAQEKAEGAFYVWTEAEARHPLDPETAEVFLRLFGVRPEGNVNHDPFSEFTRKNVLYQAQPVEKVAAELGLSTAQVQQARERARQLLFELRRKRLRPLLDDKILTSWNGLMITALARASQVLEDDKYLEAGRKAARFIKAHLYDSDSHTLFRRYREGEGGIPGFLDDYAFLIQGLLDLYETSLKDEWLLWAIELVGGMESLFWDDVEAGFFSTSGRDKSVLLRMKDQYDGAEPSPNSVALLNLIRLGNLSGEKRLLEKVHRSAKAFSGLLHRGPHAMPLMLVALSRAGAKPKQIFLAGHREGADTTALLKEVHRRYLPHRVIFLADGGRVHKRLASRIEVLDSFRAIDGRATAYVCENYVCQLPTSDPEVLGELLDRVDGKLKIED